LTIFIENRNKFDFFRIIFFDNGADRQRSRKGVRSTLPHLFERLQTDDLHAKIYKIIFIGRRYLALPGYEFLS
jgi:hypothetical protein